MIPNPGQDLRNQGCTDCSFSISLDPGQDLRDQGCTDCSFPIFLDPGQDLRDEVVHFAAVGRSSLWDAQCQGCRAVFAQGSL